jgi:hypothetical protein
MFAARSEAQTTLPVERAAPATMPDATLWTLDNVKKIGGFTPEVLGSPQIISSASGSAMQFDGKADGIVLPVNPVQGWKEFTIEVLLKPDAGGPAEQRFLHVQDQASDRGLLELRMTDKGWSLDAFLLSGTNQRVLSDLTKLHPADQWTWVAMVYGNGKLASYVDGKKELDGDLAIPPMGRGAISLGVRQNKISWFKGQIRQVRFSPVALTEDRLQH